MCGPLRGYLHETGRTQIGTNLYWYEIFEGIYMRLG